ncbi:MAG: CtsR family transcriptional regulator [Oscillospiraceae bacterium]|nr:CtsR family transcriptional regulator [Oscillospiraceae bacterium]
MGITDKIEAFINELLKNETDDWLEIKRNELASVFGCVPSQINYVIQTRFNPEHGYIVESRRGGGGYLKIKRIKFTEGLIHETIRLTGYSLDEKTAKAHIINLIRQNALDEKTAAIILSAVSDTVLDIEQPIRDKIRADIFKNMLTAVENY